MPEIRLIQDEERELLEIAWRWAEDAPAWFRQSFESEKETLEDFVTGAKDVLLYGIWDKEFTALIRLNPFANKYFSIDLFARRKTDWNMLAEAGKSLKAYLLDKGIANHFYGWLPEKNRGVVALYKSLGFEQSPLICYRGSYHSKPIKWLLFTV